MYCISCGWILPEKAHFCPCCGSRVDWIHEQPAQVIPQAQKPMTLLIQRKRSPRGPTENSELRGELLDCYVNCSISKELSDWLQDLGHIPTGTVKEKIARIRQQANSLVLASESFPRQTIFYLSQYEAGILSEICQEFGVNGEGSKETLFRRIYREVGWREGWLQPISEDAQLIIKETFLPILQSFDYEKEYYRDFCDDISDLLGEENVHIRFPLAYGSALIVVVIPEFFQEAHATLFQEELRERGVYLS